MSTLISATNEPNKPTRQRLLQDVFSGYNASTDWPGLVFLDDLLDLYPNAKVILNKRHTAQEWVSSAHSLKFFSGWTYFILTCLVPMSYWHSRVYREHGKLVTRRYGLDDYWTAEYYERHNQWVRDVAKARGKEVLEWEPEDGWKPLCKFLGCEVPDEAFPRSNETAEIERLKVVLVKNGLWAWARVLGVTAMSITVAVLLYRRWMT